MGFARCIGLGDARDAGWGCVYGLVPSRLLPSPVFVAWLLVAGDITFLMCVAAGLLP